jgi:hypothetical protein
MQETAIQANLGNKITAFCEKNCACPEINSEQAQNQLITN